MERVSDNNGNLLWLLEIPADGDCLFGAIVHQLFGMTPKHPLFKPYSQHVREVAVAELRRNPHLYIETVQTHALELITSNCSIADKVDLYLRRMLTAGYWGGADAIAALSNHYRVIFTVHQDSCRIEFVPTNSENGGGAFSRYNLFYRNLRYIDESSESGAKVHYDSVWCIRMHEAVLETSDMQTIQISGLPSDTRVKHFGHGPDALFLSILHQLTGTIASRETVSIFRCLVADEIESRPIEFLAACGVSSDTSASQFAQGLRSGHHAGGLTAILVLSAAFNMTVFTHESTQNTLRYDPSESVPDMSIHILKHSSSSATAYGSIVLTSRINRPLLAPRRVLPDPMVVAQKVARKEVTDSQMTEHSSVSIDPKRGLRFASLNVNGCRSMEKREAIDFLLLSQRVHIAVLQEVNLDCEYASTPNFEWHMGGRTNSKRRGLAILIYRGLNAVIQRSAYSGSNIQHAEVFYQVRTTISSYNSPLRLFL